MLKAGTVYIITNKRNTVLYTGVTANMKRRIIEHKEKLDPKSFAARYNCNKLVYYNWFFNIEDAIEEEKRIKGGSRKKKIELIESINPEWKDLSSELF